MFQTDLIAEALHSQTGQKKVPELPCAVQRGGVEQHMIVDMLAVDVGGHKKGVLAFGEPHGQLVAHLVGFFRRNFTRLKGLPDLVSDHIPFLAASGALLILPFGEQKLLVNSQGAARIAADQFPLGGLVWVLGIVGAVFQAGGHRFALVFVQCDQACGCHTGRSPPIEASVLGLLRLAGKVVRIGSVLLLQKGRKVSNKGPMHLPRCIPAGPPPVLWLVPPSGDRRHCPPMLPLCVRAACCDRKRA